MKILIIGNGAREHAIAEACQRSRHQPELVIFGTAVNPGLLRLGAKMAMTNSLEDFEKLKELIEAEKPDFVIAGPEGPIVAGVTDFLAGLGVPCVAPTKALAQLEGSKAFTRMLMTEYSIPGCPQFMSFHTWDDEMTREDIEKLVRAFMESLGGEFAVKADGLCGGKGVKVTGDHLAGTQDGLYFAMQCIEEGGSVVVEEKFVGQEFSLMFLTDGITLAATPAAQDHKRAFEGDKGPNTGGMGTYSDEHGSLPFLTAEDLDAARDITEQMLRALKDKTGEDFKGVMYGGFIATADGVKLIEYNARFGDPEAMNVLPILKTDFVDVCQAILAGTLADLPLEFAQQATVVKYAVPEGYPTEPRSDEEIQIFGLPDGCRLYYAAVHMDDAGQITTGTSRALAFVGIADSLAAAERIAEAGTQAVEGPLAHRRDIGTDALIAQRMMHMQQLRNQ